MSSWPTKTRCPARCFSWEPGGRQQCMRAARHQGSHKRWEEDGSWFEWDWAGPLTEQLSFALAMVELENSEQEKQLRRERAFQLPGFKRRRKGGVAA